MISTEDFETCKVEEEVKVTRKKKPVKAKEIKKGIVTLVTDSYVVYDYKGNSCYKEGHFKLNIGDEIEV